MCTKGTFLPQAFAFLNSPCPEFQSDFRDHVYGMTTDASQRVIIAVMSAVCCLVPATPSLQYSCCVVVSKGKEGALLFVSHPLFSDLRSGDVN